MTNYTQNHPRASKHSLPIACPDYKFFSKTRKNTIAIGTYYSEDTSIQTAKIEKSCWNDTIGTTSRLAAFAQKNSSDVIG
jgi:hypothetical protein